ncbi:putative glycine-rich cell wall structural protein 1 isoform X2 [Harpegnathos saltator]|uniref:putative glycine-rich cell wall structural protein 1 isoform X2 n=1 Tax=Harpegnathos saltator TaxID=610380 RepID=UPI000DBEF233|nr:putative glycine-rich cell wall structural protein 1 isoform X2 [Harpegnathos saltator]
MGWFLLVGVLLLSLCGCCENVNRIFRKSEAGAPLPQSGAGTGTHGQPQAGPPSTPSPGSGGGGGGGAFGGGGGGVGGGGATSFSTGVAGVPSFGLGVTGGATTAGGGSTGGGAGGGAAASGTGWSSGPVRRGRGWRDWRRGDPTLIKGLWKSKGPLDSLGKAEIYIIVALLIGFVTVVIGCWLSDNCWSPEPEGVVTLA